MFVINYVSKEDFFKKEKPVYIAGLDAIQSKDGNFAHILLNDIQVINRNFDKKKSLKKNYRKWFNKKYDKKILLKTALLNCLGNFLAMNNPHMPSPFLKATIREVWNKEKDLLDNTSKNKFRNIGDVNQYVFSWWDIAKGNFEPGNSKLGRYFLIDEKEEKMYKCIEKQESKLICLNDGKKDLNFNLAKRKLINSFDKIFPNKSSYEK